MNGLFIPLDAIPSIIILLVAILLSILVYWLFRKNIPKEFTKFPVWKIVLFTAIVLLEIIRIIFNFNSIFQTPSYAIISISMMILQLIGTYTFISGIHALVNLIRDKKRKNRKKELCASIWLIILLNPLTIGIIVALSILTASSIAMHGKSVCGVLVADIDANTPMAESDIAPGEQIVSVDSIIMNTPKDFSDFMNSTKPSQTIILRTSKRAYNFTLTKSPYGANGHLGVGVVPKLC